MAQRFGGSLSAPYTNKKPVSTPLPNALKETPKPVAAPPAPKVEEKKPETK